MSTNNKKQYHIIPFGGAGTGKSTILNVLHSGNPNSNDF